MASFLLGFPSSGSVETDTGVSIQNVYTGLFFQDDYRVTSRLTLNLGLRWDYQTPTTERYDRTTRGFDYFGCEPAPSARVIASPEACSMPVWTAVHETSMNRTGISSLPGSAWRTASIKKQCSEQDMDLATSRWSGTFTPPRIAM